MNNNSRNVFVVFIVLAVVGVIVVSCWAINKSFTQGMSFAVQHKALKISSAQILGVTALKPTTNSQHNSIEYRVCFLIESSSEIASEERAEYEKTLSHPFCIDTRNQVSAKLKAGESVKVGFLLENDGQIDIARIETSKESIYP